MITSCSWCHEPNEIRGAPTYCWNCRHRADVARGACDCRACWRVVVDLLAPLFGTTRAI